MTSTETPKKSKWRPATLRQLLGLCLPHWPLLLTGIAALFIASAVNLFLPELVRRFLNAEDKTEFLQKPFFYTGILIGLFALQGMAFYVRSLCGNILGQRVVRDLRARSFSALIQKPMAFFDAERVGDITSRLSNDTSLIQDAVSLRLSVFLRYSIQVIIGIVCMLSLSLTLSFLIITIVPVLVGISFFFAKKLRKRSREQQAALGEANVVAEESFALMRTVKAFNREEYQRECYLQKNSTIYTAGVQRGQIAAFFASFVSFLLNAALALILCYGILLVNQGKLPLGDLAAFLLYGTIVSVSFAFLTGSIAEIVQALGASERIFSWLPELFEKKLSSSMHANGHFQELRPVPKGLPIVEFEDVRFSYPSRPDHLVLQEVSFSLRAGQTTALVGPSGAGKSSIIASLLALYPIQSGSLRFAGKEIQSLSAHALREAIALVPQDPELFGESIYENIRFGRLEASSSEIEEAARKAHIHEFIVRLPNGYQTLVGERGIQLSGGQRQRVAIARALLRKPLLVILDEATSALDGVNEAAIREAIQELQKDSSVLIIAHRLASIQNADQVLVLQDGKLLDQGTHEELLSRGGTYQALVEAQRMA